MDESEVPSWKGHSFTLLVFGGIVVLCSIFFVLGMLVGRNQGQRIAEMHAAEVADPKNAAQPLPETQPPLEFFDKTTGTTPDDTLEPRVTPPATPEDTELAPTPPPQPDAAALKASVPDKPYWQIIASKDSKEAEKAVDKVRSKGFQARILAPPPGGADAVYRVLVGPYDSEAEAEMAKKELEDLGFKGLFPK
jgi:cell division septation protein DedD